MHGPRATLTLRTPSADDRKEGSGSLMLGANHVCTSSEHVTCGATAFSQVSSALWGQGTWVWPGNQNTHKYITVCGNVCDCVDFVYLSPTKNLRPPAVCRKH